MKFLRIILLIFLLTSLFSCVTVKVYVVQNGQGKVTTNIFVSDPDTVTTRAHITGQKNL